MADTGESSYSSNEVKPVVVRVKRKAFQSPLEAFWLEINERPLKRPLLDFGKLSLNGSSGKEELKNKKVFVQHLETVSSSDATVNIVQSFVPGSSDSSEVRTKVVERKRIFKEGNKQDRLLSKSREKHEFLANSARFEQIWSSRKGSKETIDDGLREICHLYDVVRVDGEEEKSHQMGKPKDISMEESTILCNYLPLIREFLPSVAEEIQSDMQSYLSNQGSADDYVYDLYTVQDELNTTDENSLNTFPLVQVNEDDDFYDGPMQSDYESDDSNAEDNPLNEYPDEETSEDEDDGDKSRTSCEESEIGSSDDQSYDNLRSEFGNEDLLYEEEVSGDDDYDGDGGHDCR
ncbi:hypothetical protein IFM89_038587 [Coptis chinensis]|uniref:Transcription factor Iwr1 domain-containing protein n=1 Tax=Coptis chinensis TaxID=261450 RepID=A0A835HJZ7_9MAGN|nr:hypothetical protein IFM89_038587 [Coptis chinensis]